MPLAPTVLTTLMADPTESLLRQSAAGPISASLQNNASLGVLAAVFLVTQMDKRQAPPRLHGLLGSLQQVVVGILSTAHNPIPMVAGSRMGLPPAESSIFEQYWPMASQQSCSGC